MSKQIVLRAALVGVCTLMIGLAGCSHQPATTAPPPGTVSAPPQSVLDQVKSLPPEQRQRAMDQMKAMQAGTQSAAGSSQTNSSAGKQ